ncbi:MAG: hypothetical protein WBE68_04780 [Candidatus Nitrosopolaris sp.]
MNRTTSVIVALIAAATLSTIGITVPHQQALACSGGGCGGGGGGCGGGGCGGGFFNGPIIPYWAYGFLGNGGVLISPPVLAGFGFDGCGGCGGCGSGCGGFGGGFGGFGGGFR